MEQLRYLSLWWDFCWRAGFWEAFWFFCCTLFFFFFFFFFSSIFVCLIVSAFNIPKNSKFFFPPNVLILSWICSSISSVIYYFHNFTPCELFTPALVSGLSLKSDSNSPQFSWTLLSILADLINTGLDDLDSSTDFHFLQPLLQAFGDCSKRTNYNWYNLHSHVP